MSRKRTDYRRDIKPDSIYSNVNIAKFINKVMLKGKKSLAERIVYTVLDRLSEKTKEPATEAFEKAIKNITPLMEVKSRRVGGSTYQVPVEVRPVRGRSLALRWLINNTRNRSGKSMVDKLSAELLDAYNKTGSTMKKREDTHKMAEANKAFAHFRW
ncbi:MAG: 30S ribosomal protein S7 [bacterium]|nr:30S ribosomal protein S7 [bacterium]